MIVGISGGIGSGKSCVTQILKSYGFKVIDADQLAREVVKKGSVGLNKLVDAFGNEILTKDGRLNRKKTAKLCFGNDKNYKKLNKIVGKACEDLAKEKLLKYKDKNVALEVILLFEASWDKMCDKTISVTADTEVRIRRVIKRDHCTRDEAISRINRQMSDEDRNKLADIVVVNNTSLKELEKQVIKELGIKKG